MFCNVLLEMVYKQHVFILRLTAYTEEMDLLDRYDTFFHVLIALFVPMWLSIIMLTYGDLYYWSCILYMYFKVTQNFHNFSSSFIIIFSSGMIFCSQF